MLVIDDQIRSCVPDLTPEEFGRLEKLLLRDGCRDPLTVWAGPSILLDGHHRYTICRRHDIPFKTITLDLASHEEAILWVIDNQLGRRNLTPAQASYLRGREYNMLKREQPGRPPKLCQNDTISEPAGPTRNILAAQHGVSPETISRDGQFAKAVDAAPADIRGAVLAGKLPRSVIAASAAPCVEDAEPDEAPRLPAMSSRVPTDPQGLPIRDELLEVFGGLEVFAEIGKQCQRIGSLLRYLKSEPAGAALNDGQAVTDLLDNLAARIDQAEPVSAVCPRCQRSGAHEPPSPDCPTCKGRGWVTRSAWASVPAEWRQAVLIFRVPR